MKKITLILITLLTLTSNSFSNEKMDCTINGTHIDCIFNIPTPQELDDLMHGHLPEPNSSIQTHIEINNGTYHNGQYIIK